MAHTAIAVRDIEPEEELTISYIDASLTRAERQERLADWGFECACEQCTMSAIEIATSDARLNEINEIVHAMDTGSTTVTPEMGSRLVQMYRDERLFLYLGHANTRAA